MDPFCHHSDCFSEGNWGQAPHSSVPWGVYSGVLKAPVMGGSETRGEGRQEPTENEEKNSPFLPQQKQSCGPAGSLLTGPHLPGSLQPLGLYPHQAHPECPPNYYSQSSPSLTSGPALAHLPTCSSKCSWTRCVLSSDCTPDRYSITRCEGKRGERRVSPTEHPPLPATALGALTCFPSSPPHASNKRLPCPSHG